MTWLSQKTESEPSFPTPSPTAPSPQAAPPSVFRENRESHKETSQVANIGKSLHVKGELSGSEDLTIDGKVEGKITLNGHNVIVGQNGNVTAEIQAKSVVVNGQVKGNIVADEKVEVAATGNMLGDVRSPRIVLADGARFKGSIDMDMKAGREGRGV